MIVLVYGNTQNQNQLLWYICVCMEIFGYLFKIQVVFFFLSNDCAFPFYLYFWIFFSHYYILHRREVDYNSLNTTKNIPYMFHTKDLYDFHIPLCRSSINSILALTKWRKAMGLFKISRDPSFLIWN